MMTAIEKVTRKIIYADLSAIRGEGGTMANLFVMLETGAEGYTVISEAAFYTAQTYARTKKEAFRYHDYHFEIIDDSREDEIECTDFDFMPESPSEDFGDPEVSTREYNWLAITKTNQRTHLIGLYGYTETDVASAVRDLAISYKCVENLELGYTLQITEKGIRKVDNQLFYVSVGGKVTPIWAPFGSFAMEKAAGTFRCPISEIEIKKGGIK